MIRDPEWLERRRSGIGSSDVAAILGVSPYGDQTTVYMEKMGTDTRDPSSDLLRIGRAMEAPIFALFQDVEPNARPNALLCTHPVEDWAIATPDGFVFADDTPPSEEFPHRGPGVLAVVEVKHLDWSREKEFGSEEDEDPEIPEEILCQVQWQMFVTGLPLTYIPVLFGGRTFRVFRVRRDQQFIDMLVERCREFWFDVVKGEHSPLIGPHSRPFVESKHTEPSNITVAGTPHLDALVERYFDADKRRSEADEEREWMKNLIIDEIGPARGAKGTGYSISAGMAEGRVAWKAAAVENGVTPEIAEKYRGPGKRRVTIRRTKR